MNRSHGESVRGSRRARTKRRFPGLSREDVEVLEQLPPGAARAYERELRSQLRSEQRHRHHTTVQSDLADPAVLERPSGPTSSRWSHGPGGGRKRPTLEAHV